MGLFLVTHWKRSKKCDMWSDMNLKWVWFTYFPKKILLNSKKKNLPPIQLTMPPKWWHWATPCVPLVPYPLHATLRRSRLFLVGYCVLVWRLVANLCHRVFYFPYFCIAPFYVPKNGTAFPHALHPPRATSPNSLLPLMPTLGWLLCFPFKFQPLKAKAMPITLFFDGVCVSVPN